MGSGFGFELLLIRLQAARNDLHERMCFVPVACEHELVGRAEGGDKVERVGAVGADQPPRSSVEVQEDEDDDMQVDRAVDAVDARAEGAGG